MSNLLLLLVFFSLTSGLVQQVDFRSADPLTKIAPRFGLDKGGSVDFEISASVPLTDAAFQNPSSNFYFFVVLFNLQQWVSQFRGEKKLNRLKRMNFDWRICPWATICCVLFRLFGSACFFPLHFFVFEHLRNRDFS